MNISRFLGLIILAVGIALFIFGIHATQQTGEKIVSETTGHYTDQTVWYILGGIACVIGGSVLVFKRRSK